MIQRVMELAQGLCPQGGDEELLRTVCAGAVEALDRKLRPGLAPEDCGEAFPLAAAWLAADWVKAGQGLDGVTALSAGDISVRREGGGGAGTMSRQAMELMAPFLADRGFAFRGVRG
jgi:hypothetical protein